MDLPVVIACKPMEKPYLCALIPRDQLFEEDEAAVHMQKQEELLRQANAEAANKLVLDQQDKEAAATTAEPGDPSSAAANGSLNDSSIGLLEQYMENPFTRAVKMPHSKRKRNSP